MRAHQPQHLWCVAVKCSVLPCVAVCCSVLQCAATCCSAWKCGVRNREHINPSTCVCHVQHTTTQCNTLQHAATHTATHTATRCNTLHHEYEYSLFDECAFWHREHINPSTCGVLQCIAVCCSALQCVAVCLKVCCSVLQCVLHQRQHLQLAGNVLG